MRMKIIHSQARPVAGQFPRATANDSGEWGAMRDFAKAPNHKRKMRISNDPRP